MDRGPFYSDETHGVNPVKMAQARGINPRLMDEKLSDLIKETESIELKLATLLRRLNYLRDEIVTYDQTRVEKINTVIAPAPSKIKPQTILPVPEPKMVKPKKKAKKKIVQHKKLPMKSGVYNVRYGAHSDKTRLVFDVNGPTKHDMIFDKEVGIVTITLPQTSWATSTSRTYKSSQLAGYEAKSSGQGTIVAMAVKDTSSVKTQMIGKSGNKPARLIVDLVK